MKDLIIRYAEKEELDAVNRIRKQVNDIHKAGRPDIFRADGWDSIRDLVYRRFEEEGSGLIVAVHGTEIMGFAQVQYIIRPLSAYNKARKIYHIEEFGVDEKYRRMGVASAIIKFAREDAAGRGFPKLELDMWEFNEGALAFYESVGFSTFRRYMECDADI